MSRMNDEEIILALRGERDVSIDENLALLEEVRHLRKQARGEARRADQVKRLRWAVENLVAKTELLLERAADLDRGESEAVDLVPIEAA